MAIFYGVSRQKTGTKWNTESVCIVKKTWKKNELYDVYFTAQLQAVWTYLISKIMPIFYCLIQNYRSFTDYTNKTLCSTLFLRPGTKFTEGVPLYSFGREQFLIIFFKFFFFFSIFFFHFPKVKNYHFLCQKSSIQVFFLGLSLKYLTFLLGLCQFSERSELIWQNPTKR